MKFNEPGCNKNLELCHDLNQDFRCKDNSNTIVLFATVLDGSPMFLNHSFYRNINVSGRSHFVLLVYSRRFWCAV